MNLDCETSCDLERLFYELNSLYNPSRVYPSPGSQSTSTLSPFDSPRSAPAPPNRPSDSIKLQVLSRYAASISKLIYEYRECCEGLNGSSPLHYIKRYRKAIARVETEVWRNWRGYAIEQESLGIDVNDIVSNTIGAIPIRESGNRIQKQLKRLMPTKLF